MFSMLTMILLMVVVVACIPQQGGVIGPLTPEIRKGTDAVVAEFVKNAPPDELFHDTNTFVKFSLHNRGAENIRGGVYAVAINPGAFIIAEPRAASGLFDLAGRSPLDTIGEKRFFDVPATVGVLPTNADNRKEKVSLHTCYKYKTLAGTNVCVDTDLTGERLGRKICQEGEVSLSSGQGGPVSLERIKLQNVPHSNKDLVVPEVTLVLKNVGKGEVMAPSEATALCQGKSPSSSNKLIVRAYLSEMPLTCTTDAELKENTATLFCILEQGLDKALGNYYATVRIEAEYGYHEELSRTVTVKKVR